MSPSEDLRSLTAGGVTVLPGPHIPLLWLFPGIVSMSHGTVRASVGSHSGVSLLLSINDQPPLVTLADVTLSRIIVLTHSPVDGKLSFVPRSLLALSRKLSGST